MTIAPATPADVAAALDLLCGPATGKDGGQPSEFVASDELDLGHLLVARRDEALLGAVFAERLAGGVAVLWPPRAVGDDHQVEGALTAAALDHVVGAKVVQAFLSPEEAERGGPLVRAGFRHVTRVWHMALPLAATRQRSASPGSSGAPNSGPRGGQVTRSAGASRLTVIPFSDCDPPAFHAALVRAHDNSLDCPELHGVLTPDEVLAGYRDAAPDPAGWRLALAEGEPVGVLVLNDQELTFLGVVPERRGRGIGRRLVELAVELAPALSLIVDARNEPAVHLYRAAGLEVVGAREVFLHFPAPAAGITGATVLRT
jgi:ribosomal protein S18 acetylase RimI-like enzyme